MSAHAELRTPVESPETVAAAVAPDNTAEMTTRVADGAVVTDIERDDAGGLQATVDDYVVNLRVASEVVSHAKQFNTTNHE